jgi:ParB family transcriptional regulator, chromosome partitioning protein
MDLYQPSTATITTDPLADPLRGKTRHKSAAVIDLDRIQPDPEQPRKTFPADELAKLGASIKAKGVLLPIRVLWDEARGTYVIVDGERRWRAARMAGLTQIDAVVHATPLTAEEKIELALVANTMRQDLDPMERAQAFQKVLDAKQCSIRQLAMEMGIDHSTISRAVALLRPAEPAAERDGRAASRKRAGKPSNVRTIRVAGGVTVTITGRRPRTNEEIVASLREALALLARESEATTASDGRCHAEAA